MEDRDIRCTCWKNHVHNYECDSMGVVYHASYSSYMDEAWMAFLESLKLDSVTLKKWNLRFSILNYEVSYRCPLTNGNQFVIETKMERTSKLHFHFVQYIYRQPDKALIAEGRITSCLTSGEEQYFTLPKEIELRLRDHPSPD